MPGAGVSVLALRSTRWPAEARQPVHREGAAIAGQLMNFITHVQCGIDIYAKWDGMTDAEKKAQVTGFSVEHGYR